jgi:Polyketide synthase dehydratase
MALEAVRQVAIDAGGTVKKFAIKGLSIVSPIILADDDIVETLFNLRAVHSSSGNASGKWFDFDITSANADGSWSEHASGHVTYDSAETGK